MLLQAIIFLNDCHSPYKTTDSYLSVLTLKLQLSDNVLQNQIVKPQMGNEDSGAATVHR